MADIFMNATSDNGNTTVNTDGTNTYNSRNIVLLDWTVQNGSLPPLVKPVSPLLTTGQVTTASL